MDLTGLLIFLAIGAIAGWLAGKVMTGGLIGSIAMATVGAIALLHVVGLIKKA